MGRKPIRIPATLVMLCIGLAVGLSFSQAVGIDGVLCRGSLAQAEEVNSAKRESGNVSKCARDNQTRKAAHRKSPAKAAPQNKVQRFGLVIGLKREKQIIYNMLHAHPWAPINQKLKECNIQNYSIYEMELNGELYLFAYFEYTGDNFKADMAKMKRDKITQQWWKLTDPCQRRLPGTPEGEQWRKAEEVYRLD